MRNKKILAIGILIAGIGYSAYLLFYNSGAKATSPTITGSERSGDSFVDLTEPTNPDITDPSLNITDEVAKEYTKKIVQMNTGGQGKKANIILPDATAFETIVRDYLSKNIQFKEYTEKDLRINATNTKDARIAYLQEIQKAQNKTIATLKTSFVYATALYISNKQSDELQKHINVSEQFITKLLEIQAPQSAKQFHIDLLNVYKKRSMLANILLENSEDPLKSVVVLKEIEKLTEKEALLIDSLKPILEL